MLKNLLFWILPTSWAIPIYAASQRTLVLILAGLCVYLASKIGVLPLIALVFLLRKRWVENPLAKRPIFRYNRCNTDKGVQL